MVHIQAVPMFHLYMTGPELDALDNLLSLIQDRYSDFTDDEKAVLNSINDFTRQILMKGTI